MERINIPGGSPWEDVVGYSRAVRIGNVLEIAGTTAMDGHKLAGDNLYDQTKFILSKIAEIIIEAGGTLQDVIRTRMFVTDISLWQEAGRAHGEFFGTIKPCATMVEVSRLISADLLIEIEATAILPSKT